MSLRYMLDTNVCIAVLKDAPQTVAGRFNRLAEQICISTITLAELRHGAERSARVADNLAGIEQLVARLAVIDFDGPAAAEYGRIRAELRRQVIGPLDTLIAAHARSRDLVLVTANVKEFQRVPGLLVEKWL